MLLFKEFRRIRKTYIDETRIECRKVWQKYIHQKKALEMNITETSPVGSALTAECKGYFLSPKRYSVVLTRRDCFADCTKTQPPVHDMFPEPVYYQQEGINPMNYATATVQAATTETQDQRKYLAGRLNDVYSDKREPLEQQFGLVDDDAPTDVVELEKRLKDGAYTFRTDDKYRYYHWTDLIQWRHPDRKQDTDGFKAAVEELKALRQKALDTIKIDEPKAGLEAIKALEAWEPKGAAN